MFETPNEKHLNFKVTLSIIWTRNVLNAFDTPNQYRNCWQTSRNWCLCVRVKSLWTLSMPCTAIAYNFWYATKQKQSNFCWMVNVLFCASTLQWNNTTTHGIFIHRTDYMNDHSLAICTRCLCPVSTTFIVCFECDINKQQTGKKYARRFFKTVFITIARINWIQSKYNWNKGDKRQQIKQTSMSLFLFFLSLHCISPLCWMSNAAWMQAIEKIQRIFRL